MLLASFIFAFAFLFGCVFSSSSAPRGHTSWMDYFDNTETSQILDDLKADKALEKATFKFIRYVFEDEDQEEALNDEDCVKILSSLKSERKIFWHQPAGKLSFNSWPQLDLSLRVLSLDRDLMQDPKMATMVILKFFKLDSSRRSLEGFRIIMEGLAENVLPVHFGNRAVLGKFLTMAKVKRSQLLGYLRWNAMLKTSMNDYSTSPVVRAHYYSLMAHVFTFFSGYLISILKGNEFNPAGAVFFMIFSFCMGLYYFDNFLLPF